MKILVVCLEGEMYNIQEIEKDNFAEHMVAP